MMRANSFAAAQYIRMSTDAQDLSPKIQEAAIAAYAQREGLSIVETYFDGGRSGLRLQNRPAMKKLLRDVEDSPSSTTTHHSLPSSRA
jgi:DNA invertase Pin-like site-specific DNA recombinase